MYAFSKYNNLSTITLIDVGGSSWWQYYTPEGGPNSLAIKYKEIDTETDMIIVTSGSNYINYSKIIS